MKKDVYEKVEEGLTLIKEGDDRGVDILFIAMSKAMLIVAKGIVKDSFLAEDIVQESFIKVVNNISKYKKGSNGYAWVIQIVRNTALNSLNTKNKLENTEFSYDEFDVLSSDSSSFNEKTQNMIVVEEIMNSLHPPIIKEMIYMKYFLDMNVRDIAKELHKSKSYVAKEIKKAEEDLKIKFKNYGQN